DGKMTLTMYKDFSVVRKAEREFGMMARGSETIDVSNLKPSMWLSEERITDMKSVLEKAGVKDGKMDLKNFTEYTRIQEDKRAAEAKKDEKKDEKGEDKKKEEKSESKEEKKDRKEERREERREKEEREKARRAEESEKPKVVEEKRVTYRFGNLPKDLPKW